MRSPFLDLSLWVVGPGRAGSALVRSWVAAGGRAPGILARDDRAAREGAARLGGEPVPAPEADSTSACDLLIVAVPDDRIASVAERLAGRVRCRWAFHLSGALPASALTPLAASGARLASIHPLRAFTGAPSETWAGAFVAVEGDSDALEAGLQLAAEIGAEPHRLTAEAKPLYHAGATLAAGGTVALLSMAVRAWVAAGLPDKEARQALARLAIDALRAVAERDFAEAFTGPVARRDLKTVRAHLAALAPLAGLLRSYALLADETLRRTPDRGGEDQIRQMLSAPTPPPA